LLLPVGFQLERARELLKHPGDLNVDDIQEFIYLSSAREATERKQKEGALKREKAQVAEIKAAQAETKAALAEREDAQARTAAAQASTAAWQRITRWAFAAIGAVILIAGATVAYLQWDKAQQLAMQQRRLDDAQASVSTERASNAALTESLNRQLVDLDHARANILSELSETRLLRGELDSAFKLASHGARIDLALAPGTVSGSSAAAQLAAFVSKSDWRLSLSGHENAVRSVAFSPDGARIVTASSDNTARIWDAATAKEIAVLRGHERPVFSAVFSPDGARIITASSDNTARIWDAATAREISAQDYPETDRSLGRTSRAPYGLPASVAGTNGEQKASPAA
jgi:hypothetical protein